MADRVREYRYRHEVFPGLSHDDYMDEPVYSILFNLHIHQVMAEHAAKEQREARNRRPAVPRIN